MSVSGYQEQGQNTLQTGMCSYSNVFLSVYDDLSKKGHSNFPRKYFVEDNESFIVSLESTARVCEVRFMQRCEHDEEGAKPVPLAEYVIKELGPIYYKQCKGSIKTPERKYSVSFQEDTKIPQRDIEFIRKILQAASTYTYDTQDLIDHPWSENKLIGIVDDDGEEIFLHNMFPEFNPYQCNWDSNWLPKS